MKKSTEIKELLVKYVNRDCSQEEIDQIVNYFKHSEDFSTVPTIEDVSKILEIFPDMDEDVANRIFNSVIRLHKPKKPASKNKFQMWRYAGAAVLIGILMTLYFFKDKGFPAPKESAPKLVDSKILTGTDKATLTLADGSVVVLNKENTYKTNQISSNGEQIVYKDSKTNTKEIVYNYLNIPRGGQFFLELADGTKVWLNSESQLKYPINFIDGETRQVELVYGEAFFDVSPSYRK